MLHPERARPGDRVAVLSPASALPAVFPAPFERGLRRLRDDFGLEPVEFPTTRELGASPERRAADVHAAFADPTIAAVLTSIGGDDEIKVLKHLDADLLRANPKPFFGVSDNTNLLMYLWNLGIVGYYGGTVMTDLGRSGRMHPLTEESLRAALFTGGGYELRSAGEYNDQDMDWNDPATGTTEPRMLPAGDWRWHGPSRVVTGPSWGGCLELIDFNLRAGRYLRPPDAYDGAVLLLETSEELPPAEYVYRVLMGMGERGLLQRFGAVLVGRAKAWSLSTRNGPEQKAAYAQEQHAAVLRAMAEYHPDVPVVLDIDFGHTDPHLVLPIGGGVTVDPVRRAVTVTY